MSYSDRKFVICKKTDVKNLTQGKIYFIQTILYNDTAVIIHDKGYSDEFPLNYFMPLATDFNEQVKKLLAENNLPQMCLVSNCSHAHAYENKEYGLVKSYLDKGVLANHFVTMGDSFTGKHYSFVIPVDQHGQILTTN